MKLIPLKDIEHVAQKLARIVKKTPLVRSEYYSNLYNANIYFKREDEQVVRSYKIRGAYNKMSCLTDYDKNKGVVCASAGNHAQGVALACKLLSIKGVIFMPDTTPKQKVEQVNVFGNGFVEIQLVGDTFDDSYEKAIAYSKIHNKVFIHPFDDLKIIEGQATVGLEILEQMDDQIDTIIVPVGGGGLISGIINVFKVRSPKTKIIGCEPQGAPSMSVSLENKTNTHLDVIDRFVDGASVRKVGNLNFGYCKAYLDGMVTVHEGKVCQIILELYNRQAIVVEPAGALSIATLSMVPEEVKGKNVVCIVSGGNNDIMRTPEIKEKALLYSNLKHYFIVKFPQRAGSLREFVNEVLGPKDDITFFEYHKKHNKENGSAIIGVELSHPDNFQPLIQRMKEKRIFKSHLNKDPELFDILL